ncbi:MAG TPA: hypothetical protein VGP89_18085 [Candidatus Angelobacter sp.]|jgi:hypothetical protein|nr:hypothetical protein [Candidatus Angelobacter sp.]
MSEEVKLKPLTKKQLKFVECFAGNLTDAARKAGLPFPNVTGAKMMKLPAVKAAIEEKKSAIAAATKAVVVASGTELGTAIGVAITRDSIAQRAWAIAQSGPDNMGMFTSQVNALKFLGELMKFTGDAQEGEIKSGMIKRADGEVEVYQSKWIKQQPSEYSPDN